MKVYVLGKRGSIVHWVEDSVAGFRAAGHEVRLGVTRDPRLSHAIDRWLMRPARIVQELRRFQPDLILAIVPHGIPLSILRRVATLPGRPPLVGWVGDRFGNTDREAANLFDAIAYTDTGLLATHRKLGFRPHSAFVPHAASPRMRQDATIARRKEMVFIANPTPHRRAIVAAIAQKLCLYGPGWGREMPSPHETHDRRVHPDELATLYQSHRAVLNIRHESNVLDGLNQRHFDAGLTGTPVIADEQADLTLCFEPGREILVYQDAGSLNALYIRLLEDPTLAAAVGAAAHRRVVAEHTYAQRLGGLGGLVGV